MNDIDAKINRLESRLMDIKTRSTLSWLDIGGLGVAAIILVATGWACVHAYQQEQEAANAPKVEQPLPPGYRYIDMPGGEPDVITFCDLGNRIYRDAKDYRGETISVIPNDPSCS